jgi:hypothetical protein
MKKHIQVFLVLLSLLLVTACSRVVTPGTQAAGGLFPQVRGSSLDGKETVIPDSYAGSPVVLLVGYQQKTQFDIDRWILGILQAEIPVKIVEVPTIAGMMPQMVQGFIDNGMRRGIPKEDWAAVVTVYEDAAKIVSFLGNERPQSAYVVLLNSKGEVVWTTNRGYSASQVLELKQVALQLR